MSNEAMNYVRGLRVGNRGRKYLLTLLADHADEQFSCHPSVPFLASICEVTDRMVQMDLKWLREQGFMSDRECFRTNGSQTSNRYYLHGPWDDFGGTGIPFPLVALPERIQISERPFREGTRAARGVKQTSPGGVKSTSPPGVQLASPGGRTQVHPGGVADFTGGMSSTSPLGVRSTSPLEPPEEPSAEPTPPPPSVGTVTIPGARVPGDQEEGTRRGEASEEVRRKAADLLGRVGTSMPPGVRPMTADTIRSLTPLVAEFLSEPGAWSPLELLTELQRDLDGARSVRAVLHDRLTRQLDPFRATPADLAWEHERPRPAAVAARPLCDECQRPLRNGPSADGLCTDCRTTIRDVLAQLAVAEPDREQAAAAVTDLIRQGLDGPAIVAAVEQADLVVADTGQLPGQLGVPMPGKAAEE
jgi:hypothetical protein